MKSCVKGYNYHILPDGEKHFLSFNKKRTDAVINKLKKASETIGDTLEELYESDYDAYALLVSYMFLMGDSGVDYRNGKYSIVDDMITGLSELQNQLANGNDAISPFEDVATLDDYGFSLDRASHGSVWQRVVVSTEDKEVVDEIVRVMPGSYLYRERTILWEKTDYGRRSESITYKNKRITKSLMKAIKNTFEPK